MAIFIERIMIDTVVKLPYQKFYFKQPLRIYESRLLRSAILKRIEPYEVLYHNHLDDGVRMDYPLIQYKSLRGQGAILYLGEGIESIYALFSKRPGKVRVRGREINLEIDRMESRLYRLFVTNEPLRYKIFNWIPLQGENYREYRTLNSDKARIEFLGRMLIGNILSFAKGVDWYIDNPLELSMFRPSEMRWITYKNVKLMAFDADFAVNAVLPAHIGLGKGAAHNYGVVFGGKQIFSK